MFLSKAKARSRIVFVVSGRASLYLDIHTFRLSASGTSCMSFNRVVL